ncbi:MAG TPA: hypothetical protein VFO55_10375 [Gemmatimonadaceae bacterium]|nr:hypothetical protein [Gemmatimonadaceae bacterium]
MDMQSGRYYAVHFSDLGAAVDYCGEMVPHVVRRLRSGRSDGIDAPAIWFHTHPRSDSGPPGCDLLMTRGAILAALEGGMRTPPVGPSLRQTLPAGAVLVLGEDRRQAPIRGPRPADAEKILEQVIQLSA